MNPQKDYSQYDKSIVRALVHLFQNKSEKFNFPVDGADEENTVAARLVGNNEAYVKILNNESLFEEFQSFIESETGITIIDTDYKQETDTEMWVISFEAEDVTSQWNKSILLVYGTLRTELVEKLDSTFSDKEIFNIRNHYVIRGENVSEDTRNRVKTELSKDPLFSEQNSRSTSLNTARII